MQQGEEREMQHGGADFYVQTAMESQNGLIHTSSAERASKAHLCHS